ncbi:2-oxo-tetronate isomerase [Noviherbaspirillum denitrificans]|uniref:Hydroxypyruvate isomerase n=1 Tax=Noviherbaspirillum denitrificans TaxID=1968433 RepID=A0A254TJR2_9BURK|nr:2-oxo-tetronate isomerase [Noviherbaspirillum denitrificans]OWW22890.1 hydroxypyruvate isomerase [Noviherbaspirillum denitrificans]
MPRFAANLTMMFNEVPFLQRFEAAAKAGFKGVEFLFPYEHPAEDIARELKSHGLENVLFNLPPGDWSAGERGIACLPGREAEFREGVLKAIGYAKILGTPRLHMMAGIVPHGADVDACHAAYIANLRHACEEAARHGIAVMIEPINTRDMPGYFLNLQADAHAIREEVGAANLKVQMDFYHAQIMEGDLATKVNHWLPHIGHIQVAGVPARNEPDTGEVNYPFLFNLLDELGYDGWIGCEYRPAKGTVEGLGWIGGR